MHSGYGSLLHICETIGCKLVWLHFNLDYKFWRIYYLYVLAICISSFLASLYIFFARFSFLLLEFFFIFLFIGVLCIFCHGIFFFPKSCFPFFN